MGVEVVGAEEMTGGGVGGMGGGEAGVTWGLAGATVGGIKVSPGVTALYDAFVINDVGPRVEAREDACSEVDACPSWVDSEW